MFHRFEAGNCCICLDVTKVVAFRYDSGVRRLDVWFRGDSSVASFHGVEIEQVAELEDILLDLG